MSRPDARVRWTSGLPVGLAFLTAGLVPVPGQTAPAPVVDTQQSAYRSSIAQESVRKQADKIQGEMSELVTELQLNGLGGANLATLSQASTHLSGMSQEEMQKVVNALQSASIAADDGKRQQSLVSAYQGQQALVLKLKQLAASLASQQAGDRLINQIETLIARQSANLRETTTLTASGQTADKLDDKGKSLHGVVSAEQTAIGGQIDLLFSSLAAQTAQAPATPDASFQTAKSVLDAMNGTLLKDTSQAAVQTTNIGPFPDAVTKQTSVKQYLTAILKTAQSKADASERLTQAKSQLDQVLADQKDLNDVTKNAKLDPATLAERQAEVNDRAEVAKALAAPLNPDAAKKIDDAQKAMQQSTDALNDPQKKQDATTKQDDATKALADASQALDKQLADVQKQQNQSPTDQMAQLQKAEDEIKRAQQEQNVSPQEAAKDAQQAQQDALAQSPAAADKLADAAAQLQQQAQQSPQSAQSPQSQQSAQSPQSPQSPPAAPDPNSAAQKLADAAKDIADQKAALAQAAQDYQALQQASQALTQAQKDAQAADQSLKSGTGNDLTDPARKLTDAQAQIAQASQGQKVPDDAKGALQKAADALKSGSIQAVQANRSGADAQTQQAMAAQGALSQAMAQVQAQSQQQQGQGQSQSQQQMAQNQDNANGQMLGGTGVDMSQARVEGSGRCSGSARNCAGGWRTQPEGS